jgi:hypothetical protein
LGVKLKRIDNLPMSRVKFNARVEYEYLDNFKVLQQCFKRNGIDKVSLMSSVLARTIADID